MARLFTEGFEHGAGTYVTTLAARSGTYGLRRGGGAVNLFDWTGILGTTYYARAYCRLSGIQDGTLLLYFNYGVAARLSSAGKLQLWNQNTNSQIGSDSSVTLQTGVWYRIELKCKIDTGTVDEAELLLDGASVASGSNLNLGDTAPTSLLGYSVTYNLDIDDVALNDSSGTDQNSWPGEGAIVMLWPTSNNSIGNWLSGSGTNGTNDGSQWDSVNNTPPSGTATPMAVRAGISNKVSGAGGAGNGDFNMTTYTDAGIGASDTITLVQQIIAHGEDINTGTKTGTFKIVSNPDSGTADNVAQGGTNQFGPSAGGAVGTYPTNWVLQRGALIYVPSVTKGTAPVARITKTDTGTRAADCCLLGILVEYAPPGGAAQTLSPSAIDSGESFGNPALTQITTLSPSAIDSAEAFGSATVTPGTVTLSPGAIPSAEAFGSSTVTPGVVTVSPSAIGSGEAFGSAVISKVTTLSPSAIQSGEAFGSPGVQPGAVTLSPSAIPSGEALGSPGISTLISVSPSAIPSGEAFGNVTVAIGQITISPGGIASVEAFGSATVTPGTATLSPSAIPSGEAWGTPALSVGQITLSPSAIASAEAVGSPGISASIQLSPGGIASAEAFGTANIKGPLQTLSPGAIASAEAFGNATVQLGVISISPSAIASEEAFGAPTVQPGAVTLSPSGIATTEAVGAPGVSSVIQVSPGGIASVEAFGNAGISTSVTVSPGGIASAEAFGTPLLSTGSELIPTGIVSAEAFGTPAIQPGAVTLSPSGIASGELFGIPGLAAGAATLSPTGIPSEEAFGTPFAGGSATLGVVGIGSGEAFGLPGIIPGIATITMRGIPSGELFGLAVVNRGAGHPTQTYAVGVTRILILNTSVTRRMEFPMELTREEELTFVLERED